MIDHLQKLISEDVSDKMIGKYLDFVDSDVKK